MKIGLLVCDHVQDKYQDQFGDYPDMFKQLFPNFHFDCFQVCDGEFPIDLDDYDAFMATGSKHSVYDQLDWIKRLKTLIAQLFEESRVFVGFCFGHQLIGEALGGHVSKAKEGWCVGVHTFQVVEEMNWMTPGDPKEFNLLMMCQDQVLRIPEKGVVIASSAKCPVGMIQVADHFLGIQAHPEFSKEYDKMLMETRMNRMGDQVAMEGIKTLGRDVHSALLVKWITTFIANNKTAKTEQYAYKS